MVYEHEIPPGSKLYFGSGAKAKRDIESHASKLLMQAGFNEMVTPYFSYHQHLSVSATQLLRFSDRSNSELSLRADSTVDVVRIALRRLKEQGGKWFYIQPVFRYPSSEFYQVGAESIGISNLPADINLVAKLFNILGIGIPKLQLSHMKIPSVISSLLDLKLEFFEDFHIEKFFMQNIPWLNDLVVANSVKDLESIKNLPHELIGPIDELITLANACEYSDISLVPLYYSRMRYYEGLFFRFLSQNAIFAGGGEYEIDSANSSGFAIYTDALIEKIVQKDLK